MTNMGFGKGLCIGMIAGAAIGMAVMPSKKTAKNRLGKTLRAAGELLEQFTDSIGL